MQIHRAVVQLDTGSEVGRKDFERQVLHLKNQCSLMLAEKQVDWHTQENRVVLGRVDGILIKELAMFLSGTHPIQTQLLGEERRMFSNTEWLCLTNLEGSF